MISIIDACSSCDLAGKRAVPPRQHGKPTGLYIVGEAPGAEEERLGQPFVGESGELLWRMLNDAGVSDVYLTNVLKHRPPHNKLDPKQAKACAKAFLQDELKDAKVVVCVGATAASAVGVKGGILRARGRWRQIDNMKAVAMPHPAYMLRRKDSDDYRQLYDEWVSVLRQAVARLEPVDLPPVTKWGGAPEMAVDIETDGLDPRTATIQIIGAAALDGNTWGILDRLPAPEMLDGVIMHNAIFDATALELAGELDVQRITIDDTMVMAHLTGEQDLTLKGLASRLLGLNLLSYEEAVADKVLWSYCAYGDARSTALLYQNLSSRIDALGLRELYDTVERPLTPILVHMTAHGGFSIDKEGLNELAGRLQREVAEDEYLANEITNHRINISSPDQVAHYLYDEQKVPIIRFTKSGKRGALDDVILQELRPMHPLASIVLSHRRGKKMLSTYVEPLLKLHKVSSVWHQCGTITGRLSSSSRNLQNLPREITHYLTAPEGHSIVHIDLAQIELRTAAHFSNDPGLRDVFFSGGDPHANTAKFIYAVDEPTNEQRKLGKIANCLVVYGGDAHRLVETALKYNTRISIPEAEQIVAKVSSLFPMQFKWARERGSDALAFREARGLWGRRFVFPRPETMEQAAHVRRCAIDYPNQGAGADITKRLMKLFTDTFGWVIVCQVHDSIDMVVPDSRAQEVADEAIRLVRAQRWLDVPLEAECHISKRLDGSC